jgi:hypothetical protein
MSQPRLLLESHMPVNRSRPLKLQNILGPYLQSTGLKRRLEENRMLCLWPEIVGKAISENTQPLAVRNRVLQVKVINSVWMQQLQYLKGMILQKIKSQSESQEIEDIKFYLGEIEKSKGETGQNWATPVSWETLEKEEKEKIAKEVEPIRDPDIRECLARLFARGIQMGKRRNGKK